MVQTEIYEKLVEKYGPKHQLYVTIEEMGEAIAKISQFLNRDRDVEQEMIEEIADVVIMTEQCKVIYGDRLVQAVLKKLNKAEEHLKDDDVI